MKGIGSEANTFVLAGTVSDNIYVQYVGFEAKASVRQYIFCVREVSNEPREFILTIANEAFASHRARFQDAPDICSLKLRHELAIYANHPPKTHLCISDEELENYRDTHTLEPAWVAHQRERFRALPLGRAS